MIQASFLLRRPNSEMQRSDTILERFIAQSWNSRGEIALGELYSLFFPGDYVGKA